MLLFALVGSSWKAEKSLFVLDGFSLLSAAESTGRLFEALALLSFDSLRLSGADSARTTRPHSNETVKEKDIRLVRFGLVCFGWFGSKSVEFGRINEIGKLEE